MAIVWVSFYAVVENKSHGFDWDQIRAQRSEVRYMISLDGELLYNLSWIIDAIRTEAMHRKYKLVPLSEAE
jgi:hypothetical protein